MISFILPAHNEEQHIGAAVRAVNEAATQVGEPFEVIVVNDASTDRTAEIAESLGATVLHVSHRQISATRNSGAKAAKGDVFFFVDADTLANADAVRAALDAMKQGAPGGGCVFTFDGKLPWWGHVIYPLFVIVGRTIKLVGGCFLFCTREAYEKVGGFDQRYFAAEELAFIDALKKVGRINVPWPTVVTSARKLRTHSAMELIRIIWTVALHGPKKYQKREGLEIWYGERKHDHMDA